MKTFVRIIFCAVLLVSAGSASAYDKIWAGLILATNENPPGTEEEILAPFQDELKSVFGYNTFYLIGDKKKKVVLGTEEWLVPSKNVFLHLKCTDRDDASYQLALDVYRQKELLVQSNVRLTRDMPLFIRGPNWGKGLLVYVLEIR